MGTGTSAVTEESRESSPPVSPGIDRPIAVYDLDMAAVGSLVRELGQPAYRADQVWQWLYVHLATSFAEMTNLPLALRDRLAAQAAIDAPQVAATAESADRRARKDLLRLRDGETIETVLMRYRRRRTACISTQVGCAVGCPFCATGQMGFRRHLSAGEITAQALHFARLLRANAERLTNVVLMGMGEPLLNYDASLGAVRRLCAQPGFGLGQRRITLSTVGIVPAILRLAREQLQIKLAISLHAATDDLRNEIIPLNDRYGLDALFAACHDYATRTGRRVTFEWALIEGVNDTEQQAEALAARLAGMPAHVNLIPVNPTEGYPGQPPSREGVDAFAASLKRRHISYTVRLRRGLDIQAGCGQLRQRQEART
jgi:23S rRNA (adenine2503-C2)-methyltransferase